MTAAKEVSIQCYQCRESLDFQPHDRILRLEECPKCYSSVHCCKMCEFYDQSVYNECRETMANRVIDKDKANFCDFYKLKGISGLETSKDEILSSANALFKD